jgi:hypothetical protein
MNGFNPNFNPKQVLEVAAATDSLSQMSEIGKILVFFYNIC